MPGLAGETAMELRVFGAADTESVVLPLRLSMEAVIVVEPGATAVATPVALMVATFAFASVQVAELVTSAVEPSL